MAQYGERAHADTKQAVMEVGDSGLNHKQSSHESYQSAETGRYISAASTRSPKDSRSVTPDSLAPPSETTASSTPQISEDSGFDPRNTNLDYFHGETRFAQQISEGEFTKIKGLSDCCRSDGKVELHQWRKASYEHQANPAELTVVVKRVIMSRVGANVGKERNERVVYRGHCQRHAEDCLNEIGVYCYLAKQHDLPQYILRMHTSFQASSDVWLVLEHANDGDLFAVAQRLKREGSNLSANQLVTWTWQLLQAVQYLHKHAIGHRDISMENVLLCNGMVKLMDFGQSVRTHSAGGAALRYFNALGKPYYRPPECHCPMHNSVDVHVPPEAHAGEVAFVRTTTGDTLCEVLLPPTALPGQVCAAEPWGYAVPPVDIFACGVCVFIMATGMPPWRQANLSDPHFAWVHQCGISQLVKAWKKAMPKAADELMAAMVQSDPTKRPSAEQCLSHSWFTPLHGMAVPVHEMCCLDESTSSSGAFRSEAQLEIACMSVMANATAEGDPYGKNAVVRSVAASLMQPVNPAAFGGILDGDFYNMPEDTLCRSAGPAPEELTLQRFTAAEQPPKVPTSEVFAFEPTTFHVSGKEPAELANHLLDFLTMAAGAVVKKVSIKKFTFKAEVNGEDGTCTLKVRIYDQGEGTYAVEFQRREGESTALHKVFDQASDHFSTPTKHPEGKNSRAVADITDVAEVEKGQSCQDVANRTWPTMPTRAAPGLGHRPRGCQGMAQRRSVPAPKTRTSMVTTGSSKMVTAEVLESIASERAIPVGSALNAARSRSKVTSKRWSPNTQLPTPLQLNTTM